MATTFTIGQAVLYAPISIHQIRSRELPWHSTELCTYTYCNNIFAYLTITFSRAGELRINKFTTSLSIPSPSRGRIWLCYHPLTGPHPSLQKP